MIEKVERWFAVAARTTPAFMLLRGLLFLVANGALVVAAPVHLLVSPWVSLAPLVAVLVAALPRSGVVTFALLLAVVAWIAATAVYDEPVSYLRMVTLAALLYGTHVLAALAAVIPNDAIVSPGALLRLLPRTGLLIVGTALLGLLAAVLPDLVGGTRTVVAGIAGFVILAGLAYYLARQANRS